MENEGKLLFIIFIYKFEKKYSFKNLGAKGSAGSHFEKTLY